MTTPYCAVCESTDNVVLLGPWRAGWLVMLCTRCDHRFLVARGDVVVPERMSHE